MYHVGNNTIFTDNFINNLSFSVIRDIKTTMFSCPQQTTASLPYYPGYTRFAIWPSPNSVSNLWVKHHMNHNLIDFQANSYYALFSKAPICSPVSSGQSVNLPFFPGHLYAAYQAEDDYQVDLHFSIWCILIKNKLYQGVNFTYYQERPTKLCYHTSLLEICKLEVLILINADYLQIMLLYL